MMQVDIREAIESLVNQLDLGPIIPHP